MAYPLQPITVTASTLTLSRDTHGETVVIADRAAGVAFTLPDATGSGATFRIYVKTTFTSDATIKVPDADNTFLGVASTATTTTGAGTHEAAGGTDDTITLNGTTTGGIAGSYIELRDLVADTWFVNAHLVGSGTLATPFSATVS